ncbi:2 4-dienoyl reductase precursor [Fusarium beomiforme]|uniref:enoyl-[acyl-carrier-protein] reductase n=1 Tax=Fusarium beomiforme TaxID=44412 RepID=A0A9P5AV72_9HYPO|nr:2 4-dienoyl reductase precursor [Fusarium beomiforme]
MATITQVKPSDGSPATVGFHYGPQTQSASLSVDQILVSFLFSPINPQDLLVLAGRYPVKPLHTLDNEPILGYDGVARVEAVGPNTSLPIRPGDLVVPRRHGLGTWRSQAILSVADVIRLSPTEDLIGASLLRMAFLPAYLLVEDMRTLKPGDWIIQNAGSGAIARLVAQFARLKGVHTASVVRNRDPSAFEALKTNLQSQGVDVVITEDDLATKGTEASAELANAASQGRVVLAIDAVFGESGERLANALSHGGTYVNYGSLGGAGGILGLTQRMLFWSEIQFRNFRLSEQLKGRSAAQQESLLLWFQDLIARGLLHAPPVETVRVPGDSSGRSDFERRIQEAITADPADKVGRVKHVLQFGGI